MHDNLNHTSMRQKASALVWENRLGLLISCVVMLAVVSLLPSLGVAIAFLMAIISILIALKEGSLADIGFRVPQSPAKLILLSFVLGAAIEMSFQIFFNPLIEAATGSVIDLSAFDNVRGNAVNYLSWLLLGWLIGGFIEEITFRGYLITRLRKVLGSSTVALSVILVLTSASFGLAHLYQGISGVLNTGCIALIFGIIFVKGGYNLWLPILTHGFVNTVGFTLIYLDLDKHLRNLW